MLVLGTGGLNSNTIPHLCGLGVGTLTLLDRDQVDARNFARQYLYRWSQLGEPKAQAAADWVRGFDPTVKVSARQFDLDGPESVPRCSTSTARTWSWTGSTPRPGWTSGSMTRAWPPASRWCARAWPSARERSGRSIPATARAGTACSSTGTPGSPPTSSPAADPGDRLAHTINDLYLTVPRTNRGIGPVAGLLGSLAAFEVLRYLTRFEPPAYAGASLQIDFARGCATSWRAWPRHPPCPACSGRPDPVPAGRAGGTGTAEERKEVIT